MSEFTESLLKNNIDERILKIREEARAKNIPILRDGSLNLLLTLVKAKQPKRILEIGSAFGCSSVAMLLVSSSSTLTGIEIDENSIATAKETYLQFGFDKQINILKGSASDLLKEIEGSFDFIFLDGPKGHYFEYLPNIMRLLNKDGILFSDNVLFRGYISGAVKVPHRHMTIYRSLTNFLNAISNDETLLTTVLDIEDGVSISTKIK